MTIFKKIILIKAMYLIFVLTELWSMEFTYGYESKLIGIDELNHDGGDFVQKLFDDDEIYPSHKRIRDVDSFQKEKPVKKKLCSQKDEGGLEVPLSFGQTGMISQQIQYGMINQPMFFCPQVNVYMVNQVTPYPMGMTLYPQSIQYTQSSPMFYSSGMPVYPQMNQRFIPGVTHNFPPVLSIQKQQSNSIKVPKVPIVPRDTNKITLGATLEALKDFKVMSLSAHIRGIRGPSFALDIDNTKLRFTDEQVLEFFSEGIVKKKIIGILDLLNEILNVNIGSVDN